MDERERRIGLNQALFREVNERLDDLNRTFATITDTVDLVCECGDARCTERITMSIRDYEALRSNPHQFAVIPGHERAGVERVLEKREGYDVVEKEAGLPQKLAETTDPRAD